MELDLLLKKLILKVIEETILNGKSKGDDVLIPCLPVIPPTCHLNLNDYSFTLGLLFRWLSTKHRVSRFKWVDWFLKIHDLHMENYMFAFSRVGNPTKLFIFPQDGKTKKYRVYHSPSISNISRSCGT